MKSEPATRAGPIERDRALDLQTFPLAFLPAFEAAGRLGSFAAAAKELHLTPSAISQQVRALEEALGYALFERGGRAVVLTHDGRNYLEDVRHALDTIVASTARLRRRSSERVFRVTTVALAAQEFLIPRLARFRESFPGLELQIEASNEIVDLNVSDFDAAIRVGSGWTDLAARPFAELHFAMVCAPQLAARIARPADLAQHTFLLPTGQGEAGFATLLDRCGYPVKPRDVWQFDTCHAALLAAAHGLGFTFAAFPLAAQFVRQTGLIVPFPERVRMPGSLSLVYRPRDEPRFPYARMAAWLEAQVAELPQLPRGRILFAS